VDFAYTKEDEAFREELTAWLGDHLIPFLEKWSGSDDAEGPSGAAGVMKSLERRRAWQRKLNEGRWAAIHWPVEWGGRDATITQNVIYSEVMAAHRTPGIYNANGLWQIGPMIIKWGTKEQKQRWIPNILNADDHWCQGFTEPEAGSDLANLRTTAIRDGDDYLLRGQKIWISSAHIAKWGLFLVRTDPTAIDEMFFDDARVPVAYRLGGEGEGWLVAMGTLGKERVGTSGLAIGMRSDLDAMISLARSLNPDALQDPELRERIARAHTDIEYTKLLNYRALSKILKNQKNWPEVPLAKLQWSHLAQTLAELAVDLLGPAGMMAKGSDLAADGGSWNRLYVFQRYTSIGAGTTEVQKNIIADRALKLPKR
jgi:alkylation response protein AidB-like acyl-CoA dehydrogenase